MAVAVVLRKQPRREKINEILAGISEEERITLMDEAIRTSLLRNNKILSYRGVITCDSR